MFSNTIFSFFPHQKSLFLISFTLHQAYNPAAKMQNLGQYGAAPNLNANAYAHHQQHGGHGG